MTTTARRVMTGGVDGEHTLAVLLAAYSSS